MSEAGTTPNSDASEEKADAPTLAALFRDGVDCGTSTRGKTRKCGDKFVKKLGVGKRAPEQHGYSIIESLSKDNYEHVPRVFGTQEEDCSVYFGYSFAGKPLDEVSLSAAVAKGVLVAFQDLSARGIKHGDVRLGNVVVDVGGRVSLIDFENAERTTKEEAAKTNGQQCAQLLRSMLEQAVISLLCAGDFSSAISKL